MQTTKLAKPELTRPLLELGSEKISKSTLNKLIGEGRKVATFFQVLVGSDDIENWLPIEKELLDSYVFAVFPKGTFVKQGWNTVKISSATLESTEFKEGKPLCDQVWFSDLAVEAALEGRPVSVGVSSTVNGLLVYADKDDLFPAKPVFLKPELKGEMRS